VGRSGDHAAHHGTRPPIRSRESPRSRRLLEIKHRAGASQELLEKLGQPGDSGNKASMSSTEWAVILLPRGTNPSLSYSGDTIWLIDKRQPIGKTSDSLGPYQEV
jgi:hypothetical protein